MLELPRISVSQTWTNSLLSLILVYNYKIVAWSAVITRCRERLEEIDVEHMSNEKDEQ